MFERFYPLISPQIKEGTTVTLLEPFFHEVNVTWQDKVRHHQCRTTILFLFILRMLYYRSCYSKAHNKFMYHINVQKGYSLVFLIEILGICWEKLQRTIIVL